MELKTDEILRRIGALSVAVIASRVVFSYFYDWGFFFAFGITFTEAPTTISDHIRNWPVWLPLAAFSTFVVLIVELVPIHPKKRVEEYEIVKSFCNFVRIKRKNDLIQYTGFIILFTSLILLMSLDMFDLLSGIIFCFVIVWLILLKWLFSFINIISRRPTFLWHLICFSPALLAVMFMYGLESAKFSDTELSATHRIYVRNTENNMEYTDVKLLRSFEEWLLVRAQNEKISWIRLTDISQIELMDRESRFWRLIM